MLTLVALSLQDQYELAFLRPRIAMENQRGKKTFGNRPFSLQGAHWFRL
jgi:hypothetical protein